MADKTEPSSRNSKCSNDCKQTYNRNSQKFAGQKTLF